MKVDCLESQLLSMGSPEEGAQSITAVIEGFLTRARLHEDRGDELSYWQRIFLQSRVNGCFYSGEDLPERNWDWPKNTWFQERRSHMRKNETSPS